MKRRLILIDLSAIFRALWASMGDLEVSEAMHRTVERVHGLASGYDLVAICCDWPPYRRSKIHPEYKGHRSKPAEVMVEQFRRTKERLKADGFLLWQVDGFEGDDVIATAVKYAKRDGLDVTIASSDKDLLCLVDDAVPVRQLSLSTGEVFDRFAVVQKFGVAPELVPDLLALMGDKSDNIPGIPLVGMKNAAGLLREYGNALNVWECRETIKGKIGENVRAHGLERLQLAIKLVTLETDVPIDWDAVYVKREPAPTQPEEEDDMSAVDDEFDNDLAGGGQDRDDEPQSPREAMPPPPREESKSEPRAIVPAEAPPPQAIVRVPVEYSQALEPMSMGEAYRLARGLANSRLYSRFPNAEAIWAIIIRGREMGLGALTALDSMHLIEGKPSPSAHLIIARAMAHPDCEYFQCLETSATASTWETNNRRNKNPTRLTYTLAEASQAGLTSRGGNWKARPAEMIRKTCGVQLARMEYPSAVLGLYAAEEMGADDAA